jgi:hypothetical protein
MRVGASGSAVLGTIHGDGGEAVRERVVTDLDVPPASFGATDLLVTLEPYRTAAGTARRVKAVEEVVHADDGLVFEPLFELADGDLVDTGRIARGNSHLLDELAGSGEAYGTLRERLDARAGWLANLSESGRTDPESVRAAHARRRDGCA